MKKKILSVTILILFVILGFIFLKGHLSELKNIFQVNLKYLGILFLLRIANPIFKGLKLKTITCLHGLNLKFKEWFGLTIIVTFGNYLAPFRAGLSTIIIYLKKKYNLPYTSSVSLAGVLYLVQFFTFGIIGFILVLFSNFLEEFKYGMLIFFGAILFISVFLLFVIPLPIRVNIKIVNHITKSLSEFRKARDISFMSKMVFFDTSRIIMRALGLYFAFRAYNFNAPFADCLLIMILIALSLIISLTPMGLGVKESLIIVSSKLIGADILTGVFVAALDRAVGIVLIFVLAPIFSYLILKKEKKMLA